MLFLLTIFDGNSLEDAQTVSTNRTPEYSFFSSYKLELIIRILEIIWQYVARLMSLYGTLQLKIGNMSKAKVLQIKLKF